jgi:hypothetical protein
VFAVQLGVQSSTCVSEMKVTFDVHVIDITDVRYAVRAEIRQSMPTIGVHAKI